ncbi:DUF3833 domain-containing protein [Photobacterium sanctipauli]
MAQYIKYFTTTMLALALALLSGCSASIEDYRDDTPKLDLFEFFEGYVQAWGMLQDRSGKQTRRFDVKIRGEVKGRVLTLYEDFLFDDGEEQQRTWVITKLENGQYMGTADDVVGEATGRVEGNALNWRYVLRVPVDDTTYDITFNDWMYLQDSNHMLNIAEMTKWGFTVGTVTLFFEKQ